MRLHKFIRTLFNRTRTKTSKLRNIHHGARIRLVVQELEDRLTPAANITITDVYLADQNGNTVTTATANEPVYIVTDFATQDLPSNASYRLSFEMNGVTMYTSYVNWNAGVSGSDTAWAYWGYFYPTPGTNQVSVTIDPDDSVAESSYADNTISYSFNAGTAASDDTFQTYSVAQIRNAYGLNSLSNIGTMAADGTGQTIALVEDGNDPYILSDLDNFDQAMTLTTTSSATLYQEYGPASSFASVYNQQGQNITDEIADSGSNGVPPLNPPGNVQSEETMDVEWAHAIAPGAKIDIIEAYNASDWESAFLTGNQTAATLPGVSAVSDSYNFLESSSDLQTDGSTFVTPTGHNGVTFLASSGDYGSDAYAYPGADELDATYPSASPNVVSVGGTQLALVNGGYGSETGWSYAAPVTTVTNGGSGYSETGSWSTQSGGFSGDTSSAAGGSDSAATWTIPLSSADQGWVDAVEVSATWTASPDNATNASYLIYDGTPQNGTLLQTITVNQTEAPVGTADGSSQFQELGAFLPTFDANGNGTITVVLEAGSANGTVDADAVGVTAGWASAGGPSQYEPEPSYQEAVQQTGYRTTPDVSFNASINSCIDAYFTPEGNPSDAGIDYWYPGTSFGSPCWAGLIAIANQERVANGGKTLNSPSNPQQTLQALYSLPSGDYNDITSGYNGYEAGTGYDYVTGLGTPIANRLIPDLASYGLKPAITSVTPNAGPLVAGETVTITGSNFIGASAVTVNGTPVTSFTVENSTEITAVLPAHAAGTVTVAVTTPGGTTAASRGASYQYDAMPTITAVNADEGSANGGTQVTITGTNLAGVSVVDFGNNATTVVSDTATKLVVITPWGIAGATDVALTTPGGTALGTYTYLAVPTITSATPLSGPMAGGTMVTISGTNLTGATVDFGTKAAKVVSDTSTQLVVTSPAEPAGRVELTVSTTGGSVEELFTYAAIPVVTALTPKTGTVNGGDLVTITGSGLANATVVDFGTTSAVIVSDTDKQLVVDSPAGALGTFAVSVTTAGGTSKASSAIAFTYVPAADPAASTISLSSSSVTAGKTITVTLHAMNSNGNPLTTGGLSVAFQLANGSGASGTFSFVTDRGNGIYTATFTGTLAGTNAIAATIDGQAVTSSSPAVTVTPGAVSLAKSLVLVSSSSVSVGGTITVTLQAEDAYGNKETTGGLSVVFMLGGKKGGQGRFSSVTDNGDGTYTATFSATSTGSNTVIAIIGGVKLTSNGPTIDVTPAT